MIRMIKKNVERLASDEHAAALLEQKGFERMEAAGDADDIASPPETAELSEMTTSQLKELAKKKGIPGASSLTKAELMELMQNG